jgi:hypothetical protein
LQVLHEVQLQEIYTEKVDPDVKCKNCHQQKYQMGHNKRRVVPSFVVVLVLHCFQFCDYDDPLVPFEQSDYDYGVETVDEEIHV